jgi:hypothetical protein
VAKKWRNVQKSIYIYMCIFHILQCIWVLWMWSKYGDYVAFEQIVNNKCLSLAFDLNKVNKFAKPIWPLPLSELEFPKNYISLPSWYIEIDLPAQHWFLCSHFPKSTQEGFFIWKVSWRSMQGAIYPSQLCRPFLSHLLYITVCNVKSISKVNVVLLAILLIILTKIANDI